jgi:hypothetical protein
MHDVDPAQEVDRRPSDKRSFANRAKAFANRVRALPGLPIYFVGGAAAVLVMTTAGAFGTLDIPFATRLTFWLLLIGINVLLWITWFALRVRKSTDWWRAALLGMIVVNAPMPIEITLIGRLLGLGMAIDWPSIWASTGAISIALLLVLMIAVRSPRTAETPVYPKGKLWRAGFQDPAAIAAIVSEDHYCRIWNRDNASRLILARFGDLTNELAAVDGAVVRRGQWVAAASVDKVERSGRRWQLQLKDGRTVVVSGSAVSELRARGWI